MQVSQMKRAAKREQWKQRITECRSSGIPVKEWCAQHGVCPSTYYRYEHVYIFYDSKSENWFSNCDLLSFWLKIHRGIELDAVQNRTSQYTLFCERLDVFKKLLEAANVE